MLVSIPESTSLETIEVTPGIGLHIHHWQAGRPVATIPGWPLSDERYDVKMSELARHGFRAFSISLQGFSRAMRAGDPQYYYLFVDNINTLSYRLDFHAITIGKRALGGAIAIPYIVSREGHQSSRLALFGAPTTVASEQDAYPVATKPGWLDCIEPLDGDASCLDTSSGADEVLLHSGAATWFVCQGRALASPTGS